MTEETAPALQPWRDQDGNFHGKDDAGDHIDKVPSTATDRDPA